MHTALYAFPSVVTLYEGPLQKIAWKCNLVAWPWIISNYRFGLTHDLLFSGGPEEISATGKYTLNHVEPLADEIAATHLLKAVALPESPVTSPV